MLNRPFQALFQFLSNRKSEIFLPFSSLGTLSNRYKNLGNEVDLVSFPSRLTELPPVAFNSQRGAAVVMDDAL